MKCSEITQTKTYERTVREIVNAFLNTYFLAPSAVTDLVFYLRFCSNLFSKINLKSIGVRYIVPCSASVLCIARDGVAECRKQM